MIIVLDINDNRPVCPPSKDLVIQIQLDIPVNTTIFQFTATDRDIGTNSLLTYTLEGFEQELNFFMIDPVTGNITTVSLLLATNRNLSITVNASDSGDPPLSIDCDLLITLYQVNNTVDIELNTTQFDREMFENILIEVLGVDAVVVQVTMLDNGYA